MQQQRAWSTHTQLSQAPKWSLPCARCQERSLLYEVRCIHWPIRIHRSHDRWLAPSLAPYSLYLTFAYGLLRFLDGTMNLGRERVCSC